jgi:hypothetical protein
MLRGSPREGYGPVEIPIRVARVLYFRAILSQGCTGRGRRNQNRLPPSGRGLSPMLPPQCSTMTRQKYKPRPALPLRSLPCANLSKSFPARSGSMPAPSSSTLMNTHSPSRLTAIVTADPEGPCRRAFSTRLRMTRSRRGFSPTTFQPPVIPRLESNSSLTPFGAQSGMKASIISLAHTSASGAWAGSVV